MISIHAARHLAGGRQFWRKQRYQHANNEFFSLPLFPQSSCAFEPIGDGNGGGVVSGANGATYSCPPAAPVRGVSQCSNCGTTCGGSTTICPRCGSTMTPAN